MISPDASLPVTLRPYQPQDLDAIVRLDEQCFAPSFRFSRAEMRRFAEQPGAVTLIADGPHGLAGFVIVDLHQPEADSAYLVTLDVVESLAGQGIGRKLLRAGEMAATDAGIGRMVLHVHTANYRAIELYVRSGYTQVRRLRRFYRGVPEGGDAFLYQRALSPGTERAPGSAGRNRRGLPT